MKTFRLACKYAENQWPDGKERLVVGTVLWVILNVTALGLAAAYFIKPADQTQAGERLGAASICVVALAGLLSWYLVLRTWSKRA